MGKKFPFLDFALRQDVRARTLKGEYAGFMSATAALIRLRYFFFKR